LERMSAEQIWDSLVHLSILDSDERKANTEIIEQRLDKFKTYEKKVNALDAEEIIEVARKGSAASKSLNDEMEKLQKQLREAQEADDREAVSQLRKKYFTVRTQQRSVFAQVIMGPGFDALSLYKYNMKAKPQDDRWKKFGPHLYRASELQTPAPPGHFLQEFGQSDREVVDNSNLDASVPQALSFLNGKFYGALFSKNSPLMADLQKASNPQEKIKRLFLSILSRIPTDEEMSMCMATLTAKPRVNSPPIKNQSQEIPLAKKKKFEKALEKKKNYAAFEAKKEFMAIAWSLINTRQFSFIQ